MLEDIKLRAPIEEIVAERVHLTQRGRVLWGCCPFHDEKTPSFKVDPEQGNWYCFGACRKGGDVVTFLQVADGVTFMDAVEILAARVGVALPKRRPERSVSDDGGLAALAFADAWFQRQLGSGGHAGGREARDYLQRRGVSEDAVRAFGIGFAPTGRALLDAAAEARIPLDDLERAGLVRRGEDGSPYSFFRGRLMVPIRDLAGRTVAFGARRLVDNDAAGPKYINSAESEYFHKGRLVFALDRSIDAVRRSGHLVLVEGYTDVIAAHQAGVANVCAVLGTATTQEHAVLLRRAGARRISLVFDGDEAGRQAAYRGLEGLLGLEADLEVVVLPAGQDPADVLSGPDGAAAFRAQLDAGLAWTDFVAAGLLGAPGLPGSDGRRFAGRELSRETDRALVLVMRLKRPVEREAALRAIAEGAGLPLNTLRDQLASLPRRLASKPASRDGQGAEEVARGRDAAQNPVAQLDPRLIRAYEGLVGAVLIDPSLCPRVREWAQRCPVPELARILDAVLFLWDDEDLDDVEAIDVHAVMNVLAADPARAFVVLLAEHARNAENPLRLFEGELAFLNSHERAGERRRLQARVRELEQTPGDDSAARVELDGLIARLVELSRA
ncbi:MAG: DNA primase [Planctomycetota bacterium]